MISFFRFKTFSVFVLIFSLKLADAGYEETKKELLKMAESFKGQADPDRSKQHTLEPLVEKLLSEKAQASVVQRLPLLYGAWRQVWGPYDYKKKGRGVDSTLDPENIIQVIFEGGYYYNVSPRLDDQREAKSTGILRGEYVLDPQKDNLLNVRFTNLRKINGLPKNGLRLQDLPALSEKDELSDEKTVLPGFLVKLFFTKGTLNEVYTDETMRISFGSSRDGVLDNALYVMTRLSN